MGVGGSTGDSDIGEQSQAIGSWNGKPGDQAEAIESSIFMKTGQDSNCNNYKMLSRRVIDQIKKTADKNSLATPEELVSQCNPADMRKLAQSSNAASNPFSTI